MCPIRSILSDCLRLQNEGVHDTFIPIKIPLKNLIRYGKLQYSRDILRIQGLELKSDPENWEEAVDLNAAAALMFMLHDIPVLVSENHNLQGVDDNSESCQRLKLLIRNFCKTDTMCAQFQLSHAFIQSVRHISREGTSRAPAATMEEDPDPKLRFVVFKDFEEESFYISCHGNFYDAKKAPVKNHNHTLPGLLTISGRNRENCALKYEIDSPDTEFKILESMIGFNGNPAGVERSAPLPGKGVNMEIIHLDDSGFGDKFDKYA